MAEIWISEDRRQAAWDERVSRLPRCADCKKHITDEKCLPLGSGYVCPRCVSWRMVEVEAIEQ